MAEQQFPQYRPVRRKQVGLNLPGASVTPAASPVDTYFRTNLPQPSQSNELLQLAGALAPFSKSLGNYLQFEMQNQQDEAKIQAEMDVKEWSAEQVKDFLEMSQEELEASGLLKGPVASRPDYYISAKINAGKRLGDIAQQDIIAKHGEMLADLTDPSKEINIAEAIGQIRQEVLGEFGELGFYSQKGASAAIDPLIDSLTRKTIEAKQQRVEGENIENLTVGVTEAYTRAAADGTITPGETQMLLGITQAQLQKYKAVGGKKPQDILFDALERSAGELVEDGSESVAVALMEMARTTLGPGGKPLAKPGTKAHERLLDLEDRIEKRAEENRNKALRSELDKNNAFELWANDEKARIIRSGEMADEDIEAIQSKAVELGLLSRDAENILLEIEDALERKERSGVVSDEQTLRRIRRRLASGDVPTVAELLDFNENEMLSWADTEKFIEEAQAIAPGEVEARNLLTKQVMTSMEKAAFPGGIQAYHEGDQPFLQALLNRAGGEFLEELQRAQQSGDRSAVEEVYKNWSAGGARIKALTDQAQGDDRLHKRSENLPENLSVHPLVVKAQKEWEGIIDDVDVGAASRSKARKFGKDLWRAELATAISSATKEAERPGQVPGLVAEKMEAAGERMTEAMEVHFRQAVGEETRGMTVLQTGVEVDEDLLPGEEFWFETTRWKSRRERLREHMIELSRRAKEGEGSVSHTARALRKDFEEENAAFDLQVLGSFVASGGRTFQRDAGGPTFKVQRQGVISFSGGKWTMAEAREEIGLLHMGTGVSAEKILAGEMPLGLRAGDLRLDLMKAFKDRAEYDEWKGEVDTASNNDDLEGIFNSKAGRLMRQLDIPDTIDGEPSASLFLKLQAQLLED